jgi:nucleotide-binding universal stress UspA family protein
MGSAKPRRVLVGVDFEEAGDRALSTALALAAAAGDTEIHAVHVAGLDGASAERRLDKAGAAIDRLRGHVHAALEAYRMEHGDLPKVNVRVHETHGRGTPASAIARLARALEAGLVVVGTHGRRGVARARAGSVAERLVRMAPCPVLVVKPVVHAISDVAPNDDVEPACEACLAKREATAGAELWCARHAEHHAYSDAFRGATASIRPWGFG